MRFAHYTLTIGRRRMTARSRPHLQVEAVEEHLGQEAVGEGALGREGGPLDPPRHVRGGRRIKHCDIIIQKENIK